MAFCYQRSKPNVHPPPSQAECSLGLVRGTANLQSVCADGGLYLGARAFLEIGGDAHFRAYQRYRGYQTDPLYDTYQVRDLTAELCRHG
jgi:hypothetical protein